MAKKQYTIIIDTETTITDKVVDFGAAVVDRSGKVHAQCAVLVNGIFGVDALFFKRSDEASSIWSVQGKDRRFDAYNKMLESGTRQMASIGAINRWLERVRGKYNPTLTAYNLAFDVVKCLNTDIDLSIFDERFCLWYAAADKWAETKAYREFVLENHLFSSPTALGNMSYRTNAENMVRFVLNDPHLEDEPHTSLEDVLYYELPIFQKLVKNTSRKDYMTPKGYNWRNYQVKDWFKAK